MAVYKANLFMTTSGISDQGEGEKRLGEIYVSIDHNDSTTCKEVMSGDHLPVYIKADKEDIYFPQPQESFKIKEAIEQYGICLYIKENDLNPNSQINPETIDMNFLYSKDYLYNQCLQTQQKLDQSRQQEEIAKKRAEVIKEKLMHTKGEQ